MLIANIAKPPEQQGSANRLLPRAVRGDGNNNYLFGEAGNDLLDGRYGNDTVSGYHGNDSVYGGVGDDQVWGGTGADLLHGGAGDDAVGGEEGADHLSGAAGDDRLWGGDGNDTLYGGAGADRLHGGEGDDVFAFYSAMDSSGDAVDMIEDFQMGDRIDLSRISTITGLGDITQEVSDGNLVLTAGDFELMLEGIGQMLEASDFIFG